jgi:hypothetical protein
VRIGAISSVAPAITSAIACSAARRASSSVRQVRNARAAASNAVSSCAGDASGALANRSPVAGLVTSKVWSAPTAAPSIVRLGISGNRNLDTLAFPPFDLVMCRVTRHVTQERKPI